VTRSTSATNEKSLAEFSAKVWKTMRPEQTNQSRHLLDAKRFQLVDVGGIEPPPVDSETNCPHPGSTRLPRADEDDWHSDFRRLIGPAPSKLHCYLCYLTEIETCITYSSRDCEAGACGPSGRAASQFQSTVCNQERTHGSQYREAALFT
jgi:hypothetical protein